MSASTQSHDLRNRILFTILILAIFIKSNVYDLGMVFNSFHLFTVPIATLISFAMSA